MLKVENLSVYFDSFKAVDDISFAVEPGEIFGLLGANGAGKTTTIRVMCGLLAPSQGQITLDEISFSVDNHNAELIKSRIGYMSQKFTLYDDLTIEENWRFIASLRNLSQDYFKMRQNYLTQWLALNDKLGTLVKSLPSGLKQQVALAAALFHDPLVVFLDEPTAGVSPTARAQFWNLIKVLAKEGKSIVVTTHYMDEAENCDRLALMRAGQMIAIDSPADLKKETFPHGLLRLESLKNDLELKKILKKLNQEKIISSWPCGLQHHVVIREKEVWDKRYDELRGLAHVEMLEPSLEDVFLELVEGGGR